jgi:hypothetical protein
MIQQLLYLILFEGDNPPDQPLGVDVESDSESDAEPESIPMTSRPPAEDDNADASCSDVKNSSFGR